MRKTIIALLAASALSVGAFAANFSLDKSHSSVDFSIKHLMISNVKGNFKTFDGNYTTDDKTGKLTSLQGIVDTVSINTDNQKRDDHLRSADFFDAPKYPKMSFVMTKFTPAKGNKGKVVGNLTIRNITKQVTFDAEVSKTIADPWGGSRSAVTLKSKINRKDFGLNWNKALEAGGFVVGEEVAINIELEGIAN